MLKGEGRPIAGRGAGRVRRVDLPLDHIPTREELEKDAKSKAPYTQRRAAILLEVLGRAASSKPLIHIRSRCGSWRDLTWIALGGEVVVDYSFRLKRELGSSTWVTAYANDVMGYIPSLRVLKEGGYEATITSGELAGTSWGPKVEELVIAKTHQLVAEVRGVGERVQGSGFRVQDRTDLKVAAPPPL